MIKPNTPTKKGFKHMETQNETKIPFKVPFELDKEAEAPAQEKPTSVLDSVENMLLKLEYLEGITQVCAVAFSTPHALEKVNEDDLENTFSSLRGQIKDLEEDTHKIIDAILKNNATLNY